MVILAVLGAAALFVFVVPRLFPVGPQRLLVPFAIVVLFGPPLLPVRPRYKVLTLLALVVIGPLLLPLPPLADTSPAGELASAESLFFDTGKIRIHYQVAGTDGPAIVLLHPGQPSGLGSWSRVMPELASGARVVAFDRPGAGLTAWPEEGVTADDSPYSSEAQARQTVALMSHLDIEEAVLVGSSAGGTIALLTAVLYPHRVSGLVLAAPGVYFGANDGAPAWARALLGTPQGRRVGRLLVRATGRPGPDLLESFWHDPARKEPVDEESVLLTFRVEHFDLAFTELFRTARPLGLPESLPQVDVPVMVVTGDDDRWVPLEHNERLARELPHARLEVIEDCGHLPQQEQPEAFVRLVRELVASLPLL